MDTKAFPLSNARMNTNNQTVKGEGNALLNWNCKGNIWNSQARKVLREAGIVASRMRVETLGRDIAGLAMDLGDDFESASPTQAWTELRSRIGGIQNLQSYSDCLIVGK